MKRVVENFTCGNCASEVVGDGYTNHCPCCLWSLHVDVEPGDRSSGCRGLMEPIRIEVDAKDQFRILHRCTSCGHEKPNRTSTEDDLSWLLVKKQYPPL